MSLKDLRKASGMTQREAAELFEIKPRTYQNYENGVTSPDMDTAAQFARHFGCTIGDLFDLNEGVEDYSKTERQIVDLYRSMTQDGQRTLLAIAETLSGIFGGDGAEA